MSDEQFIGVTSNHLVSISWSRKNHFNKRKYGTDCRLLRVTVLETNLLKWIIWTKIEMILMILFTMTKFRMYVTSQYKLTLKITRLRSNILHILIKQSILHIRAVFLFILDFLIIIIRQITTNWRNVWKGSCFYS